MALIDVGGIKYHKEFSYDQTKLLLELCADGCTAELGQFEELLNNGADPNSRDDDDWTPLTMACYDGKEKVVEILLQYKADVNMKADDSDGRTAVSIACEEGHYNVYKHLQQHGARVDNEDLTKLLLKLCADGCKAELGQFEELLKNGADPNSRKDGYTPLIWASQCGKEKMVEVLLQYKADVNMISDPGGLTAVSGACGGGNYNVCKLLQQHGARVDKEDLTKLLLELCEAGCKAELGQFEDLLNNGADPNSRKGGWTPLMYASYHGKEKVVEVLLQYKADVNMITNTGGQTALHKACSNGHVEVGRTLIEHGASVDVKDGYGETALHRACIKGHVEMVQLLILNGASVDVKDGNGMTALHLACGNGYVEVVRLLLQHAASVDEKDNGGQTALHKACSNRHVEVGRTLIEHGASVDEKDNYGETALHRACIKGHVEVVQLLIQNGASVDVKDKYGETPLGKARQRGHSNIVVMLKRGDFSTPAPAAKVSTTDGHDKVETATDPMPQSEGDGEGTPGNVLPPDNNTTTSPQETPKEFILPELNTPERYKCVARSALGLVYLPGTSNQTVSIEPVTDSKLHPNLESNEILLTPIVSLSPKQVALDRNQPAIIELTKSVEPTDLNPNRQLVPIYCASSSQWEELASRDCEMLSDRIRFKTTRFGNLSVKVRFPFPSASTTVDPKMQQQAKIEIQELPGFKVEVPPASVQLATEIKATILYDSPHVTEHFKEHSLASTCVRLEPHRIQFKEKVKISLPIPNYNRIKKKYPDAKLEVWLSQSTDEGVPTVWEPASFTTHIDDNGNCLATASVTHFSYFGAFWKGVVDYAVNFFTAHVRDRCQVFMSAEKRFESLLTFGVAVLLYPFSEPCQGVPPNYPYLLFDSVLPIDVAEGDVECQVDLNDIILKMFSISEAQKSHKKSRRMSRDCIMRTDFNIQLRSDATSSDLPAGATVATLLIKHGPQNTQPHEFNLIKPLESAVDQTKETPPSPATVKSKTAPPVSKQSSFDQAKAKIEQAADGLKKTTKEMKQQSVLTLSARRIAKCMQKVTRLASNTSGPAEGDEITDIMQLIVKESEEVEKVSKQLAETCTETRLRESLQAEITKIPGLAQPLKLFLGTVKKKQYGEDTAQGAVDLLTDTATNLQSIIEGVLKATDTAIIKVPKSNLERFVPKDMMLCIDDLHKVQTATWEARAKWYNCGLALGLTAGTLDAIEKSCQSKCDDCFRETLKEWLHRVRPPPSWISLCIALEDPSVGHDELAESLEPNALNV